MKRIYHKREARVIYSLARVIYSLTTDRQPVIYWATNHYLARFYFDSNTLETTKRLVYLSDVSSFPPSHEKKSRQEL